MQARSQARSVPAEELIQRFDDHGHSIRAEVRWDWGYDNQRRIVLQPFFQTRNPVLRRVVYGNHFQWLYLPHDYVVCFCYPSFSNIGLNPVDHRVTSTAGIRATSMLKKRCPLPSKADANKLVRAGLEDQGGILRTLIAEGEDLQFFLEEFERGNPNWSRFPDG